MRRQLHLHFPLGTLYRMSALVNAWLTEFFRDYQLADDLFSPECLCALLDTSMPIVGFSCMANLFNFVLYALPFTRKAVPDSVILLGGAGPIPIEQEILERILRGPFSLPDRH